MTIWGAIKEFLSFIVQVFKMTFAAFGEIFKEMKK